jgi:hypothetical protein
MRATKYDDDNDDNDVIALTSENFIIVFERDMVSIFPSVDPMIKSNDNPKIQNLPQRDGMCDMLVADVEFEK